VGYITPPRDPSSISLNQTDKTNLSAINMDSCLCSELVDDLLALFGKNADIFADMFRE
jgi:hypothetical protein